jgi:hypothetical protein
MYFRDGTFKKRELLELKKIFDRELMVTMEQELMNIPRKQVEAISVC